MTRKPFFYFSVALIAAMLWFFVGAERLVGDHEVGVSWGFFIKHRPVLRVLFSNPAQHGLDIVPFKELTSSEQQHFVEYCGIRFGLTDIGQCYSQIAARQI